MTKRIVSGVFLLIALGALGLILAGALTSGEQLIVRFLTAIIVAALGLYVISDLRLQADDSAVANSSRTSPVSSTRLATGDAPPPNSTAAFMATVTGKKSSSTTTASLDDLDWDASAPDAEQAEESDLETTSSSTDDEAVNGAGEDKSADEQDETKVLAFSAPTVGATGTAEAPEASEPATADAIENKDTGDVSGDLESLTVVAEDQSPYSQEDLDIGQWPLTPDGQALDDATVDAGLGDDEDIDGLVAIFTKQAEQELLKQEPAMAGNGQLQPVLVGGEAEAAPAPFKLGQVFASHNGASSNGRDAANKSNGGKSNGGGSDNGQGLGEVGHLNGHGPIGQASNGNGTNGHSTNGTSTNGNANGLPTNGNGSSADEPDNADTATTDIATTDIAAADAADEISATSVPVAAAQTPGESGDETMAPRPVAELEAASYAQARIIDLRLNRDATDEIEAAIRSGELDVISTLIDDGVLTTEGPISDRDVRTMVYVAFTSSELRKILLAGGSIDGDLAGVDLGPVEVFSNQPRANGIELSLVSPSLPTAAVPEAATTDATAENDAAEDSTVDADETPGADETDELATSDIASI